MMSEINLFVTVLLFVLLNTLGSYGQRTVTTSVGDIEGDLSADRGYYQFLGIPYGQVDDANPFGAAGPYPKFDNVFVANNDSTKCPQVSEGVAVGSPQCLNLHVYVPATATATSNLPVLIWIHGGFFMWGSGSRDPFGPKYLVRHDVIVVAINYRVGPYGFMCLGINSVPGNQGLKDQLLAFAWVKEHIQAFGGNPNEITLDGISAGAHAIDLHLHSAKENLYNKVIIQSGSALSRTVFVDPDREAAIKIASRLGLEPTSSRHAVSLLATADTHSVIRASTELNIQYRPCVETEFDGVESFITSSWVTATEAPSARNIPIMIGFSEFEMMISHIDQPSEHFDNLDIFYSYLNNTFKYDEERKERMEQYMRRFYLGDSAVSQIEQWSIINFDSDYTYIYPIQKSIKRYLASGASNIFYYMFAYSGGRNYRKQIFNVSAYGASHADDLGYLFDVPFLPETIAPADQLILDRMTNMWTNFIKYGNPTPEATALLPVVWTPLTNEIYHYLRIDSELSLEQRPLNKRMAFLNLFYRFNDKYQTAFDSQYVEDEDSGANMNLASLSLLSALIMLLIFRK